MHVRTANANDIAYAEELCVWYEESAKQRKTGIAKRNPFYVQKKMKDENAVIAFDAKPSATVLERYMILSIYQSASSFRYNAAWNPAAPISSVPVLFS